MVAKAVLPTSTVTVESTAVKPVLLTQDFEVNGALIVAPDTAQQWPVKLQAVDTSGVLRDLKVTPRGELQVDQQETRRLLEQQLLTQQAAAMQALDPNRGFEIR